MHVKQVELLQSGVRLLTGFQRGSGDRFEAVLETDTEEEIKAAADGLVTVCAYLLNELTAITSETALSALIPCVEAAIAVGMCSEEDVHAMNDLLVGISSGRRPPLAPVAVHAVGQIAESFGANLAERIAVAEAIHPNQVVGRIRRNIRLDPAGVAIVSDKARRQASLETAINDEANKLRTDAINAFLWCIHQTSMRFGQLSDEMHARGDEQQAQMLVTVATCGSAAEKLATAVGNLVEMKSIYPAMALARQLVEFEYLFWAFCDDLATINDWASSTREGRELDWRPSAIYARDGNEFRRSDYTRHCENGGHPTPNAIKLSLLTDEEADQIGASTLGDLIVHLRSIWGYMNQIAKQVAALLSVDFETFVDPDDRRRAEAADRAWAQGDEHNYTSSHFSDPSPKRPARNERAGA